MTVEISSINVRASDKGSANPRLPYRAQKVQFFTADTLSGAIDCREFRGAGVSWPAGIWGGATIGYIQVGVHETGSFSRVKDSAGADVELDLSAAGNLQSLDLAAFGYLKLELNAAVAANPVKATGTLTLTANPTNGETVTIGTTVYTFRTAATFEAVAGNVLIGATASDSLDNLIAAINRADTGFGTLYGSNTVAHTDVVAAAGAGDTMTVTAIEYGAEGNAIATTETLANGSFGAANLTGGLTRGRFELGMA